MEYKYVKGVSDILGVKSVMQLDFLPVKTCDFNCVFCSLGKTTNMTTKRSEFYPVKEVFAEIQDHIERNSESDHILLTGSGEPSLYAGFGDLARQIKKSYPGVKIIGYTHGSLFHQKDVRDDFSLCDIVWVTLNTVNKEELKKISRHHKETKLQNILDGLKKFRTEYKGVLIVSSAFVKGFNDSEGNVEGLKEFLTGLKPDKYETLMVKFNEETPTEEFKNFVMSKFKDLPFPVNFNF